MMADRPKELGWWEWVQNTKDMVVNQSSEVLNFVKKDIEEFSKVVSEEATSVVSSTANTLKEKLHLEDTNSSANQVKKSVSGFLNHVAEVFTPTYDDEDQEAIMIWNQQPVTLDRLQASKYAFCHDLSNFLKEPENEEDYESWLQSFQIEAHENELPDILLQNGSLSACYSALVPTQISHSIFWHRYFYEMERLEKAEEKRQAMKKRAQESNEDSQIVWEEEEDFSEKVVITEQMQKQLLADYEKEIQESSKKSDDSPIAEEETKSRSSPSSDGEKTDDKRSKSSTPSKDTEDEWEKVEAESQDAASDDAKTESTKSGQSEDWENWK